MFPLQNRQLAQNPAPVSHATSRYLALGAMLIMLALYGLTSAGWFGPNPVGSTSNDVDPLIIPPPYAFAIWGPIYLGLILFPLFQLFKQRDGHPAWIPLRQWFAGNAVANGVWLVFASYDWQWLTVLVIVFMLFSLFRIGQLLAQIVAAGARHSYWLERLVFSLYFAWVTLATVLNVSAALAFYGWQGFGISAVSWTVIMIVIAALIAGYTSYVFRDGAYAGVVVWAFVALATRHWEGLPTLGFLAAAVAVAFVGIALWNFSRVRVRV